VCASRSRFALDTPALHHGVLQRWHIADQSRGKQLRVLGSEHFRRKPRDPKRTPRAQVLTAPMST
jgi:hypothetical protein